MVQSPKLQELKQNFFGQLLSKAKLKPVSSANPNIEDRYRTEVPVVKKTTTTGKRKAIIGSKRASKELSQQEMRIVKPAQLLKLRNQTATKITKTQSGPQPITANLIKVPVPVTNSTINKPVTSVGKNELKPGRISTVKPAAVANHTTKRGPITNSKFVQVPLVGKHEHSSSLPLDDSYVKPKFSKLSKANLKNSSKPVRKYPTKDAEIKPEQSKDKAVLTNIHKNLGAKKKTLNSPQRTTKQKTDVLGDEVLEVKKVKKYRTSAKTAKSPKCVVKPKSPNSISHVSVREIKHNDSFIISSRKLQNSTGPRKTLKPEFLKLFKRPTHTQSTVAADSNKLKSCMKKNNWREAALGSMDRYVENSIPNLKFGLHKTFVKTMVK